MKYMCGKVYSKNELKVLQEKIFRSILLDNITVLKLASENELVAKFKTVQEQFLMAIRSDFDDIMVTDYMDIELLLSAMSDWYELIKISWDKCQLNSNFSVDSTLRRYTYSVSDNKMTAWR